MRTVAESVSGGSGTGRVSRASRFSHRLQEWFQLPDRHTARPHPSRLAGVCGWAGTLGLVGLLVAGRLSFALLGGGGPGWFEAAVAAVGLTGILATVTAFAALHRRWLPWLLLGAGTLLLVTNLLFTLVL